MFSVIVNPKCHSERSEESKPLVQFIRVDSSVASLPQNDIIQETYYETC
jgi:hypothetical protein